MPVISFKAHFSVNSGPRQIYADEPSRKFVIAVPPDASAEVVVDFSNRSVLVQIDGLLIPNDFAIWLGDSTQTYANEYPQAFATEFNSVKAKLTDAARRVVEMFKYFTGIRAIADDAVSEARDVEWSADNVSFRPVPHLMSAVGWLTCDIYVNDEIVGMLQRCLDKGWTPLLAMRHLYRAIQEPAPRFKWIDATIAAELAVKEALLRKHEILEKLLIEMPSPPLDKLYGDLLQAYLGERSPYLKAIREGVKKRNQLVHRPKETPVTREEADEYVNQIMKAIHHLYGLIYPDWELKEVMNTIRH